MRVLLPFANPHKTASVWELRREDSQVVSVQLDSLLSVHDEPTSPGGDPAPATDPTPSFDPGGGDFGGGGSTGDY